MLDEIMFNKRLDGPKNLQINKINGKYSFYEPLNGTS